MKAMSTKEEDENLNFEFEIKELVRLIFEKARKDSMGTSKNAWGNYIEDNSKLKSKTFIRMYDRYILGDENQPIPIRFSLNSAAVFIGYKSFAEFCREVFPEKDSIQKENEKEEKKDELPIGNLSITPRNKFRKTVLGTGVAVAIGLGSYFGLNSVAESQCMYWDDNQYVAISCDDNLHPTIEKEVYDEKLLAHFKKIEIADTTTFFEAGKPIVWYSKVDGEIEFYSAPGNHPLTGKQLNPVTHYIVSKYAVNAK